MLGSMTAELQTTAQVAERLGLTPRTIARMVDDGRITAATKLPGERGAYLFDPAEVDRVAAELAADLRARLASAEAV
jgi:excisionase family DNA binding protein